jgi:hypothetical protein
MSRCPGLHCDGCGGGELVKWGAVLAVAGLAVWWLITIVWLLAVLVGLVLVAVIAGLIWLARHGGDVATVAHAALPAAEAIPLESRPARALPAPQTVNNYFFNATPEQMAEVVRRQAIDGREP